MHLTDADKRTLRNAFDARASVDGNLMALIGLDEVRERFPDMWERNRDRIVATTRTILRQHTDPGTDVVLPIDDGNFAVLFTRLDSQEALLRASAIKAEVLRRFIGDEALGALDMRVEAMTLNCETAMTGTLGDLLASVDRPPAPDAGERRPVARPRPRKEPASGLADLLSHAELPEDALATRFEFRFEDLDFGYQPFLYADKGVISIFACRAIRHAAAGEFLTGYDVLPRDASVEQVVELDRLLLDRVRRDLVDMALRKRVAVVVAPVSLETMTNRAASERYLRTLRQVPSDLRNYLVPILCRCPADVPSGRLTAMISPLRRLSRAVSMRLETARQPLDAIKAAGAFSVGFNVMHAARTEMAAPRFIKRFAAAARKLGLRTYIDGVDTLELAQRCRAADIAYLGGRAFAEVSDHIGPVCEWPSA